MAEQVIDQEALLARMAALDLTDRDIVVFRVPLAAGPDLIDLARRLGLELHERRPDTVVLVLPEELVIGALPLRQPTEPRT